MSELACHKTLGHETQSPACSSGAHRPARLSPWNTVYILNQWGSLAMKTEQQRSRTTLQMLSEDFGRKRSVPLWSVTNKGLFRNRTGKELSLIFMSVILRASTRLTQRRRRWLALLPTSPQCPVTNPEQDDALINAMLPTKPVSQFAKDWGWFLKWKPHFQLCHPSRRPGIFRRELRLRKWFFLVLCIDWDFKIQRTHSSSRENGDMENVTIFKFTWHT